eukprot:2861681-Rhodomonas_salina.2
MQRRAQTQTQPLRPSALLKILFQAVRPLLKPHMQGTQRLLAMPLRASWHSQASSCASFKVACLHPDVRQQ